MEIRTLTGTTLQVSRACLGTMTFGAQTNLAAAEQLVNFALDTGVNFIDTANVYAGAASECILGQVLGPRRSSVVLASKVGMKVGEEMPGLSRKAIVAALENSLLRLKTDYLDLYYLHLPDYAVCMEESLEALDDLVQQGKIRFAATSNYASWQLCRLLWIADKEGKAAPRAAQPMYNLLARRIEDEFLPACKQFGIGTVAYNPLAGGLLTGKHSSAGPIAGTRFDGNKAYCDRYWNEANFRAVSRLGDTAGKEGRSLTSVALNWLMHHTAIDCVVLGASNLEQLRSNIASMNDGPLSPELLSVCDETWNDLKGTAPKYNR